MKEIQIIENADDLLDRIDWLERGNEEWRELAMELAMALKNLMDENTGGSWGLPAAHKDVIAAREALAKVKANR